MPGIATQFEILRLTIERLQAAGDPNGIAAVMAANPAYAHLGVIGPVIGDFLPSDPFPPDAPPQVHAWVKIALEGAGLPDVDPLEPDQHGGQHRHGDDDHPGLRQDRGGAPPRRP